MIIDILDHCYYYVIIKHNWNAMQILQKSDKCHNYDVS